MNQICVRPIEGELIAPGETVRVVGRPRPFAARTIRRDLPAGLSVQELMDIALAGERSEIADYALHIDGEPVPTSMRGRVRLKPGATLTFAPRLAKGDTGKAIFGIAIAVLALVAAPYLAGFLFAAGTKALAIATGLIGAGIVVAGQLASQALFPASAPAAQQQVVDSSGRPNAYSIGGAQNQADPFGPIPSILGRVRVWPRYGGQPYTEFSSDDQYLRLLFVVGYGPLDISDLKIGETPIGSFEDIDVQVFRGYPSDGKPTLYPRQTFQESLSVDLPGGDWFERTTPTDINEIFLDVVAPGGIYRIDAETGQRENYRVAVQAQYRRAGVSGANWENLDSFEIDKDTVEPQRRTLHRGVTPGQYDVRIRKSTSDQNPDGDAVVEQLVWTALRTMRPGEVIRFPKPLAIVALRIRASAQLNNVISSFNCIAAARVTAFDGAAWAPDTGGAAARLPANLFRHVLQGPATPELAPDDQIDLASLEGWYDHCAAEGFEYNKEHDARMSVFDTLRDIAAAGRARVTRTDGLWGVIWDEADVPVAQHFTPRNSWGWSESRVFLDPPHAFRINFLNQEKGWQIDERMVYTDGYTAANATRFEALELPGVTSPRQVWRMGRFHLAQAILRPSLYSLTTNWQALACGVGSKVWVAHDVALLGLVQARVRAVTDDEDGQSVTLDEEVLIEPGKEYRIRFRLADNSSVFRAVVAPPGVTRTIGLRIEDLPLPVPAVGDLAMFGEDDTGPAVLMRIRDIEWLPNLRARLTLVDDAPDIALADTGAIPAFDSNVTTPPNYFAQAPIDPKAREFIYVEEGIAVTGALLSWGMVSTAQVQGYEAELLRLGVAGAVWERMTLLSNGSAEARGLRAGSYSFRVRALFTTGDWSGWTALNGVSFAGVLARPDDVTGMRIAVLEDVATLSWGHVAGQQVSHYIVRFSPLTFGASWSAAAVLLERVDGTSTQVPALRGTYLVKAVTHIGSESEIAAAVISLTAGLRNTNVVETVEPQPDWLGAKTKVEVTDDRLTLSGLAGAQLADWPPIADWASFAIAPEGLYVFDEQVDLGEVYTSRLSVTIAVAGGNASNVMSSWTTLAAVASLAGENAEAWAIRLELRTSQVDPALNDWSPWAEFAIGDVAARAYQFRLYLFSRALTIRPVVSSVDITIDMPDRVDPIGDIVVPVEGLRVTFAIPFRYLETVLVTAIQDAGSGDYPIISNRDETGFDVLVRNAANAPVSRVVDAVAHGYGRRLAA